VFAIRFASPLVLTPEEFFGGIHWHPPFSGQVDDLIDLPQEVSASMLPFAPHSPLPGHCRGAGWPLRPAPSSVGNADVGLRVRIESGGFFTPVSRAHLGAEYG
jgi:hypothetical protein